MLANRHTHGNREHRRESRRKSGPFAERRIKKCLRAILSVAYGSAHFGPTPQETDRHTVNDG